jgi:phosphoribosylaminoimidazole-succinocarboxamide synthase
MPDAVRGKGCAIAMMSAYLFEQMEQPRAWKSLFRGSEGWKRLGGDALRERLRRSPAGKSLVSGGLRTHYIGLLDSQGRCRKLDRLEAPSSRLMVKAVPMIAPRPVSVDGHKVWDYTPFYPGLPQYLIPLENVFRFGVPRGSSLLERLKTNPAYGRQIGLYSPPREGEWLPRPVLEFFSKLEPMDRYLSLEKALNFSGLGGDKFSMLRDLSLLVAVFLYDLFRSRGLDLWDGKFEFIKVRDEILLADSITPDELRITCKGTQLSKEPLRQYYKQEDPAFLSAMHEIKEEGLASQRAIRNQVKRRLKRPVKKLDPAFRKIVEQMYQALTFRITGSPLFDKALDLDSVVEDLKAR